MKTQNFYLKGMTLTELLVVLAIVGILLLLAFPVLKPLFSIAHGLEAQTNLKHLASLQESHYLRMNRYTDEIGAIGFEQAKLVTEENGTAHYQIEVVEVTKGDFLARATSITDFDGDGTFNVWEVDKSKIPREIVAD
ncbi:MAG: type IV pilin protein [Bacteroidota bacterium]